MRDERGLSNSVSTALLLPVFLTILFVGMQWAMVAWATATAQAAAQEGARVAAGFGAGSAMGESTASAVINHRALLHATVRADVGPTSVTVAVTGRAVQLVPGFPVAVDVASTVPRERLTRR